VDTAGPVLDQLVGVRLLEVADRVISERLKQLAAQRDALLAAVADHLPAWRITPPAGGVTLWAELDGPVSSALARAVETMGVRIAPGPRFGVDGTLERFLRLPFTQPIPELLDGVKRIAAARYDLDRTALRPQWNEPELIA
jgi:DNA-binding transcriptional MocR family regulator